MGGSFSCPICELPHGFESCKRRHTYKGRPAEEVGTYMLPPRPKPQWQIEKEARERAKAEK